MTHCSTCGHERALGRCWRLSCPENGGTTRTLMLARPGDNHEKAKLL